MAVMMFVDTSKCLGCKACQVACKQWHSLPAEATSFTGSYQNPPSVSENNLTCVHFGDTADPSGNPLFLFFKNQCRHCMRPKCQKICPKGVKRQAEGWVHFTEDCTLANIRGTYTGTPEEIKADKIAAFRASCPFDIPRFSESLQRFVKCDFCSDRFTGEVGSTSCELTCPAGAIRTGSAASIQGIARARFKAVRKNNPNAVLYNGQRGNTAVVYLLVAPPRYYGMGELYPAEWRTTWRTPNPNVR